MSAPRIHHLAVKVEDLSRAEAFYVGVLGLPILRRWHDDAGALRSLWLELGAGAFLAVERCANRATPGDHTGWHCVALAIDVGERDAWRARLATAGFPVERETAYTIYARDPDGALVALSHYPQACAAVPPP